MPFPASGQYVKLGKGSLLLSIQDANGAENGFDFMENANAVSLSGDPTNVELYSSTEKTAALIDRARTRVLYTLTVSLNSFTVPNLKNFLLGTENAKTQTESTGKTVGIADVVLGKYYDLGSRQIVDVTVENGAQTPVLGEDYTINSEFGIIHILPGATEIDEGDDISVSFGCPALEITQVRIARAGQITAHLLYLADDANSSGDAAQDRLECWKVDVAPEGELNFISDEYGGFSLTMAILSDAENHADDPYGTLDRVTG